MSKDELYHYGVSGMRWGKGKKPAEKPKQVQKMKTRRKKNISIGSTIVTAALVGVGTHAVSKFIYDRGRAMSIGKMFLENM